MTISSTPTSSSQVWLLISEHHLLQKLPKLKPFFLEAGSFSYSMIPYLSNLSFSHTNFTLSRYILITTCYKYHEMKRNSVGAIDSWLFFLICVETEKWWNIKAIDGRTHKVQNKSLVEIKITKIKTVWRTKSGDFFSLFLQSRWIKFCTRERM